MSSLTPSDRIRCLEIATTVAKAEGRAWDIERVAEITTKFYNLVSDEAPIALAPVQTRTRARADKAPEIFK